MPEFTSEQRAAIDARGASLLLSAAAGSGKTTVLVERVLRLILEGSTRIDRLLVVTFTRAAASDMRAKLAAQLIDRAERAPTEAQRALCREQVLLLEHASISTLHSFCADFLRTHFETAGVDPSFRVLDDAESRRLLDEALDEALEAAYAEGGEAMMALDYGRGPAKVRELTEALLKAMSGRPDPEAWLNEASRVDEARVRLWSDELIRAAQAQIRVSVQAQTMALADPGINDKYRAAIESEREQALGLLEIDDFARLQCAIAQYAPGNVRGGSKGQPVSDDVKKLRTDANDRIRRLFVMDYDMEQSVRDMRALSGQIARLGELALDVTARLDARKRELSGLSYDDLERCTLRALRDEATAQAVRERFDYVFVDEYQDTSDIQEAIVQRVSRPDNCFAVGDVKQSIYRFRGAEPSLFLEKYARYREGRGGKLLPLTRNFRSRRSILSFVNMVFERVMTGGDAEIEYDELARLNPGLPDAPEGAPVEIHLLEPPMAEDRELDEALGELASAEREGIVIARTIRAMMAEDPNLHYRDFAILTRKGRASFSAILPQLLAADIPAYADDSAAYFDTPEVMMALSLMKLTNNLRSDVELIGALRSPAAALTLEELARIRIAHREGAFIDAAWHCAWGVEPGTPRGAEDPVPAGALAEKLRAFFRMVEDWRLRAGSVSLGALLRRILEDSGLYVYVGALPGGAQRQANLDQLEDMAARFDEETSGSVTRFLDYAQRIRDRGEGSAAHLLGENDDVVRLMTVHKSKGLEFPVVFGAGLGTRFRMPTMGDLSADRELGIGFYYFDPGLRSRRSTLAQEAMIRRERRRVIAEEMRILYVLLTRAKERLILVGSAEDYRMETRSWAFKPAGEARSHLDMVMTARARAEAEGAPLYSVVYPHATADLGDVGEAAQHSPGKVFEEIVRQPERWADPALEAEMRMRYPDALGSRKPLKLTVTGLLREVHGPEAMVELQRRPAFMQEEGPARMTGAERGTAYHRAMQLLRLDALRGMDARALEAAVEEQLAKFAARGLMTPAQRGAVRPDRIAAFLDGPVGSRLLAARRVHREWPFDLRMRADEALTKEEAGAFGAEEILVQGTIDCCFIEHGAWILLDYKTDRTDDVEALKARYAGQMNIYALALERITGIPVRQRLLCLLGAQTCAEV